MSTDTISPRSKMLLRLWLTVAAAAGGLTLWLAIQVAAGVLGGSTFDAAMRATLVGPAFVAATVAMLVARRAVSWSLRRDGVPPARG